MIREDMERGAGEGVGGIAYVDTPEFLNRVETDDFLQEIIPVVLTLKTKSAQ
jgi:hypothetical protein